VLFAGSLAALVACGPGANNDPDGGGGDGGAPDASGCASGAVRCDGLSHQSCVDGAWVKNETCDNACDAILGCTFCQPNIGTCSGEMSTQCLPDGSAYVDVHCDPVQGMSCDTGNGRCAGACSPDSLGQSYVGCDYFPTVTAQLVSSEFLFAVAISNTTSSVATVTIDGGALGAPMTFDVQPGSVSVQTLPWVPTLKKCNGTGFGGCVTPDPFVPEHAVNGAYRLRSTQPVTAYQFSPLDYTNGSSFSYTNDASILLPANSLGRRYVVGAYPFWPSFSYPGFTAITATQDDTVVTVASKVAVTGNGFDFQVDTPTNVTMQRGDVLQLLNMSGDLTGSSVVADKPIQVMGGHYCTNVPEAIPYCDHLEESMLPIESLSTEYAITAPALPAIPAGKERVIRIIAADANTNLTYDPPLPGAATTLAAAGDFTQVERVAGDYVISADKKIMVIEFMEGQDAGGGTGDPALAIAVPTEQYRMDYQFHAPINYESNYVNVTAPTGAAIMLDGVAVTGFTQIGTSTLSVARVAMGTGVGGMGDHAITGDMPFGITVYGYGQYTSYWYPGGLDLTDIVVE
jgi:hypothetical protein